METPDAAAFRRSFSYVRMAEIGRGFGKRVYNYSVVLNQSCHTIPGIEENKGSKSDTHSSFNRVDTAAEGYKHLPGRADVKCLGVMVRTGALAFRHCAEYVNNMSEINPCYLLEQREDTASAGIGFPRMALCDTAETFVLETDVKRLNVLGSSLSRLGNITSQTAPCEMGVPEGPTSVAVGKYLETQTGGCHLPIRVHSSDQTGIFDDQVSHWRKRGCPAAAVLAEKCKAFHQMQRPFCTLRSIDALQLNSNSPLLPLRLDVALSSRAYTCKGTPHSSSLPLYRSKTAYYDILHVSPGATQAQIKTAYYKQCFIYHPDKSTNSDDAQRFSEISEAYSVVGSVALRKKYDRGILTQSDLQGVSKPPAKEASSSSSTAQPYKKSRCFSSSTMGSKPIFDFDAFYQAHYGEQLQREKVIRWRREQLRQRQRERFRDWKLGKLTELCVTTLLAVGGTILFSMYIGK